MKLISLPRQENGAKSEDRVESGVYEQNTSISGYPFSSGINFS